MSERKRWLIGRLSVGIVAVVCLTILWADRPQRAVYERIPLSDYVDYPVGTVVAKNVEGNKMTIEVLGYGKLLVSQEEFDKAVVGRRVDKAIEKRLTDGKT